MRIVPEIDCSGPQIICVNFREHRYQDEVMSSRVVADCHHKLHIPDVIQGAHVLRYF